MDREKTSRANITNEPTCESTDIMTNAIDCCHAMEAGVKPAQQAALHATESYDTQETAESEFDTGNECPICMSPFMAEEAVSWSPNEQCNHVCKCLSECTCRRQSAVETFVSRLVPHSQTTTNASKNGCCGIPTVPFVGMSSCQSMIVPSKSWTESDTRSFVSIGRSACDELIFANRLGLFA